MRAGLFPALAATLAVILFGSLAAAQTQPLSPPPAPPATPLSPEQLDRLTAPIALYPDPLLAQILIAATYPLEIVEAHRWLQQLAHAVLKGDQLAAAVAQQPWDPSIKSLVAFPQILRMMDTNLTWTEQLGDAFLASEDAVMDSIQRLRRKALAAGKLKSTPQQVVSEEGGIISIEPPETTSVYVPIYNPNVVYGEWPYLEYPPDYFPGFFPEEEIGPLGYGWFDFIIIAPLWGWGRCEWAHHRIHVDPTRFSALDPHQPPVTSDIWQHNPAHRDGVPYRDPAVRARFESVATAATVRSARGFPTGGAAPLAGPAVSGARPAPAAAGPPTVLRPTPPILQSFGRGAEVRAEAQRGQASRMSPPAPVFAPRAAAPIAPAPRAAAPAPAAPPAHAGAEHR